jgi:uncharacterized membrane protein
MKMRHKNLAAGTALILFSLVTLSLFLITCYTALQAINPVAAFTALTVALIGIAWFKKTSR